MKVLRCLMIAIIVFQLSGCKLFFQDKHIRKPFESMVKKFEEDFDNNPTDANEAALIFAKDLREAVNNSKEIITHPPKLDGQLSEDIKASEKFVKDNEAKVEKYFSDIEKSFTDIVAMVKNLGEANLDRVDGKYVLTAKERAKNESLILFALMFMRNAAVESMNIIMPFTIGTYAEAYENNDIMMNFRESVFKKYMGITGFIIIADKDVNKTMNKIQRYAKQGFVEEDVSKYIGKSLRKTEKREKGQRDKVESAVHELDNEQTKKFEEAKAEFMKNFEGKSFLYDPSNPDNVIVVLFTWIGNLTWGGINSIIGLGWVLVAAIVSPFSRHVDFPTLKLSRSGSQIYADVTNTAYFRGKISLGIFELDHGAGWSFASGHEAGHATQSALLGPLYLPVVALSYALNGGHGGFIEHWADAWAHFHDSRW